MALNKKTRTVSTSAPVAEPAQAQANPDFTALQTALASIVQLVTELSNKLAETNSRVDELEGKLNAALEDSDEEDSDEEDSDEEDSDEEDSELDDEDVTADEIDCNKVYKHFSSVSADDQKAILAKAVKDSGIKNINARSLRKDANAALAVAEVMCDDKYGWEAEDFLKD